MTMVFLRLSRRGGRRLPGLVLLLVLAAALPAAAAAADGMADLCRRLRAERRLDEAVVDRYLGRRPPVVDAGIIAKNLKQVEKKASYDYFLTRKPLEQAVAFLQENRRWLEAMEKKSPVSKELVVAIFLVESHFGRYGGRYPLLQVFTSLALCQQEPLLRRTYELLRREHPRLSYQWLQRRAARKSSWAYQQLLALLQMTDKVDIAALKGSWAGAFGVPQFIPTSFLQYGVDGDGDGTIDLYNYRDAAASVMHYLARHGWRPGLAPERQRQVIMTYNHSRLYADTILAIRDRLRRTAGRASAARPS